MDKIDKKALSIHRLDTAKRNLNSSESLISIEDYQSSINRSYYAVFHSMRAVLALNGLDYKKHSTVISKFRELYIKTSVFDEELSKIIKMLFTIRGEADYEDFFVISKEETKEQLENARKFYNAIETYLKSLD